MESKLQVGFRSAGSTGKNNRFPFLDILGYLKNTLKNPKFGKVRQVPTREFPTNPNPCVLEHKMNYDMNLIQSWLSANKLTLNVKKTKYMLIREPI